MSARVILGFFFVLLPFNVHAAREPASFNDIKTARTLIKKGDIKTAKRILLFLHEKKPDNAEIMYELALIALDEGNSYEAEQQLLGAVDAGFQKAFIRLGELYLTQDRQGDAEAIYNRLLSLKPESFQGEAGLAGILLKQQKGAEGVAILERVKKNHPDYIKTYKLLAGYYGAKGDLAKEQENLLVVIAGDVYDFKAGFDLALSYQHTGDIAGAVSLYADISKRSSDAGDIKLADAWMNYLGHSPKEVWLVRSGIERVDLLLSKKEIDPAIKTMESLLKMVPTDYNIRYKLALSYLSINRIDDGIEELKKVAKLNSTFSKTYVFLGNAYERVGKTLLAMKAYEHYLNLEDEDVLLYWMKLAQLYFRKGETKDAAGLLEVVLAQQPGYKDAVELLAKVYESTGEEKKIKAMRKKSVGAKPYDAVKMKRRAMEVNKVEIRLLKLQEQVRLAAIHKEAAGFIDGGDLKAAAVVYEKGVLVFGESSDLFLRLALSYSAAGNLPKAINEITKAAILNDKSVIIEFVRASFLERRGQIREALNGYLRVISLDPEQKTRQGRDAVERIKKIPENIRARKKAAKGYYDNAVGLMDDSLDGALSEMRKAFTEYPEDYEVNIGMARILEQQGKLDQAVMFLESARSVNPARGEANLMLGGLYMKKQYLRLARKRYLSALASGEFDKNSIAELKMRIDGLANLLLKKNSQVDPLVLNAKKSMKNKKNKAAVKLLQKAVKIDRDNPNLQFNLGIIYKLSGNIPDAVSAFSKAITFDKTRYQDHLRLGRIYEEGHLVHLARREYRLVMEIGGYSAEKPEVVQARKQLIGLMNLEKTDRMANWYFTRGNRYFKENKHKKAFVQLVKAVHLNSANSRYFYSLGVAHETLNEVDGAISAYEYAILLDPANMGAYFRVGALYDRSARYGEAARSYRQTLRMSKLLDYPEKAGIEQRYRSLSKKIFVSAGYAVALNNNATYSLDKELDLISTLNANITWFLLKRDQKRIYISYAPAVVRHEIRQLIFSPNNVNLVFMHDFSNSSITGSVGANYLVQTGGMVFGDKNFSSSYSRTSRFPSSLSASVNYTDHHLRGKTNIGLVPENGVLTRSAKNPFKNDFDFVRTGSSLSITQRLKKGVAVVTASYNITDYVDPDEDNSSYNLSLSRTLNLQNRVSLNVAATFGQTIFKNIDSINNESRVNSAYSVSTGFSYQSTPALSYSGSLAYLTNRTSQVAIKRNENSVATGSVQQVGSYNATNMTFSVNVNF